ncbi:DgyrCDS5014 [Dimorphilus gyrociliatus]|uniref:DgyrCDS5014 n=1 Tax=Dimorphilus gyrociliatus TaxID=2664684 RepID=A0A7I8VKW5_9ANNE|nr:DgyrCDS5014 [Dimorphilus gyrociliatus]
MAAKFICIAVIFLICVQYGYFAAISGSGSGEEDTPFEIPECTDENAAICHLSGCTKVFRKHCFGSIYDAVKTNLKSFLTENDLDANQLKTLANQLRLEATVCPSKSLLRELFEGLCAARKEGLLPAELQKCSCPF